MVLVSCYNFQCSSAHHLHCCCLTCTLDLVELCVLQHWIPMRVMSNCYHWQAPTRTSRASGTPRTPRTSRTPRTPRTVWGWSWGPLFCKYTTLQLTLPWHLSLKSVLGSPSECAPWITKGHFLSELMSHMLDTSWILSVYALWTCSMH